ncbi:dienelactone hydrolase family protein [Foetidibacter luteolus]|uniref:carboxylesterase family protein n=1 Tax=Foetidibacter luteolus TaxID=2608880 RepID=UPI00129BCD87|nr:dienelactone hydrolase family protein [Foetidibacter luteolus]
MEIATPASACRKPLIVLSLVTVLLFVGHAAVFGQKLSAKSIALDTNCHGFYEYLPDGYEQGEKAYPLLIFLHGVGELGNGGTELPKLLRNGPMKLITTGRFPAYFAVKDTTYQFIVLAPQFMHWPWPGTVYSIIDYALANYRVNKKRVYLSGISMGGGITWECVGNSAKYSNLLAAVVPVCGASRPDSTKAVAIANANLPVWATHNREDPVVTVEYTDNYISYINSFVKPPGPLARKTIFQDAGHDAWTKTYDPNYKENGLNVYEWMLLHCR